MVIQHQGLEIALPSEYIAHQALQQFLIFRFTRNTRLNRNAGLAVTTHGVAVQQTYAEQVLDRC